jgi:hypothetical protein
LAVAGEAGCEAPTFALAPCLDRLAFLLLADAAPCTNALSKGRLVSTIFLGMKL